VLTGSKLWTTHAHYANWMFLLARTATDGKPQAGISFLLTPMDVPGLTVKPIISISGEHEVNQCFFDDVRHPGRQPRGEEHQGWTVAKALLEFERGGGAAASGLIG
jgi:acyl-CoA dehydrogenase